MNEVSRHARSLNLYAFSRNYWMMHLTEMRVHHTEKVKDTRYKGQICPTGQGRTRSLGEELAQGGGAC